VARAQADFFLAYVLSQKGDFEQCQRGLDRSRPMFVESELINDGKVTPAIDRTFALESARAAMRHLEAGRARGKIIITI
jgi:NADPH:quinone reductase-like Zn-dependent oxidoreductase